MSSGDEKMDASTMHKILSETSRRTVIKEVATLNSDEEISGREIAEVITDLKGGNPEAWYGRLRHRHLPTLERHQAIEWDEDNDRIYEGEYTSKLYEYMVDSEWNA